MNPAAIIKEATADGVNFSLSLAGTIKATGEQTAVNRWLPIIRDNKPAIVAALRATNEPVDPEAALVAGRHGLTLAELKEAAGEDWPDIEHDSKAMEAMAKALQLQRMRERGEVPAHYTATTTCARCGMVPIFPGCPEAVLCCPWCFNRVKGLPIAKPLI